ncbi:autophagy protein 5 [Cantharellus anzutake]|uniref:autophagy protein 5 n=1 Tax=Cantharellus anzutake TaxID=1750568 RepID=UPI001902FA08|nr:autophagy protein 5 [Cantharellus anzutake]KAF8335476.1 autophagy protein 5 [Cantharellus anzutake]
MSVKQNSHSASTTLFRRLIFDGTVPLEIKIDLKDLPANSDRSLEYYYVQAPRISYLPLLIPDVRKYLAELVLDDSTQIKEEDWWFEETSSGALMKWHWPIGALYDGHTVAAQLAQVTASGFLNGPGFDPTPAHPLRLTLHLTSPPTDKLLLSPSIEACKQAFMGQVKEADFLRWGNTRRVTGLRKQEQDGMWDGLREHNFDEFWRHASKIFPAPGSIQTHAKDSHLRSPSIEPVAQAGEKDDANNVRSVPVRIHLPDGPVLQDVVSPLNEDGRPTMLRDLLRNHVPLLFPPQPSVPLAYAIIQGVVVPGEAEVAWLNTCMGGIDGFLSIFIGIGIAS